MRSEDLDLLCVKFCSKYNYGWVMRHQYDITQNMCIYMLAVLKQEINSVMLNLIPSSFKAI